MEQVRGLSVVQQQSAGDGRQHVVGDASDVALLQTRVPVGAHPGEYGDFFAAQPGNSALSPAGRKPDLFGGDPGTAGGEEVTDVGPVRCATGVHVSDGTTSCLADGGCVCPPSDSTCRR